MNYPFIFFLSGASGSGKTTIVSELKKHDRCLDCVFLHFDSIGIPSSEEMIAQTGSIEKWQERATYQWVERIATDYKDKPRVIIEGQTNLDFIEAACHKFKISQYSIVLIDCNWHTMKERLLHNRQQAELVNQNMENWANFLRKQAQDKKLPIVNTSHQPLEQVVESVAKILTQAIATA